MLNALLIALVAVAALACPVMMLLGRRGIGPGCALMGCKPKSKEETIESLRTRQHELGARIAKLETGAHAEEPAVTERA